MATKGLVGLSFGNSPAAIAPWGGKTGVFGTNPLAFAAPRQGKPPLVIDMSLSKVARGKVNVAAQKGEAIPEGADATIDFWACAGLERAEDSITQYALVCEAGCSE